MIENTYDIIKRKYYHFKFSNINIVKRYNLNNKYSEYLCFLLILKMILLIISFKIRIKELRQIKSLYLKIVHSLKIFNITILTLLILYKYYQLK